MQRASRLDHRGQTQTIGPPILEQKPTAAILQIRTHVGRPYTPDPQHNKTSTPPQHEISVIQVPQQPPPVSRPVTRPAAQPHGPDPASPTKTSPLPHTSTIPSHRSERDQLIHEVKPLLHISHISQHIHSRTGVHSSARGPSAATPRLQHSRTQAWVSMTWPSRFTIREESRRGYRLRESPLERSGQGSALRCSSERSLFFLRVAGLCRMDRSYIFHDTPVLSRDTDRPHRGAYMWE